jgi:hypothetical protein
MERDPIHRRGGSMHGRTPRRDLDRATSPGFAGAIAAAVILSVLAVALFVP